jgi:aryl-alcohol dehydrogenase-like predicted oxidoreductase
MEAYMVARQYNLTPPTMEQPEYNLFKRDRVEDEYRNLYTEFGLGTTIWSPLASGVLTGKYNDGIGSAGRLNLPGYEWLKERYESEKGIERIKKTKKLALLSKNIGIPLHHLALAWCLKNPNVSTVILGASKLSQLEDNINSLSAVEKITNEVNDKIEAIVQNRPADPIRL